MFLTWANARGILDDASVLSVLAVGVTVVLVIGEFDLSVGFVVGLAAAAGVAAMSFHGWPVGGGSDGAWRGLCRRTRKRGVGRDPAYSLVHRHPRDRVDRRCDRSRGHEDVHLRGNLAALRRDRDDDDFRDAAPAIIAAGVALLFLVILRTTVYGRHASSIGDNPAAARLAGVPATRVRVIAFMLTGLTAGLGGVFVTSSAGSYYPGLGTGYLLPAYAAAFLGLSLGGGLRFNVLGSYLGVLLLGMVTTGLTVMNQPSWIAALVQGLVLIAAVAGVAVRRRGALGR